MEFGLSSGKRTVSQQVISSSTSGTDFGLRAKIVRPTLPEIPVLVQKEPELEPENAYEGKQVLEIAAEQIEEINKLVQSVDEYLLNPPRELNESELTVVNSYRQQLLKLLSLQGTETNALAFQKELNLLTEYEKQLELMDTTIVKEVIELNRSKTIEDLKELRKDLEYVLLNAVNLPDADRAQLEQYISQIDGILSNPDAEQLLQNSQDLFDLTNVLEISESWYTADEYEDLEKPPDPNDPKYSFPGGDAVYDIAYLQWQERKFNWAITQPDQTYEDVYGEIVSVENPGEPPKPKFPPNIEESVQYAEKKKMYDDFLAKTRRKEQFNFLQNIYKLHIQDIQSELEANPEWKPEVYSTPPPLPPNYPKPVGVPKPIYGRVPCTYGSGTCYAETEESKRARADAEKKIEAWDNYLALSKQYLNDAFYYALTQKALNYADIVPFPDESKYGPNKDMYEADVEQWIYNEKLFRLNRFATLDGKLAPGQTVLNLMQADMRQYMNLYEDYAGVAFGNWEEDIYKAHKIGFQEAISKGLELASVGNVFAPIIGRSAAEEFERILKDIVPGAAAIDDVIKDFALLASDPQQYLANMGTWEWWLEHGTLAAQEAFKVLMFNPAGAAAYASSRAMEYVGGKIGGEEGAMYGSILGGIVGGVATSGQVAARLGGSARQIIAGSIGGGIGGGVGTIIGEKYIPDSKLKDEYMFWASTAGGVVGGGLAGVRTSSRTPSKIPRLSQPKIDFAKYANNLQKIFTQSRNTLDAYQTVFRDFRQIAIQQGEVVFAKLRNWKPLSTKVLTNYLKLLQEKALSPAERVKIEFVLTRDAMARAYEQVYGKLKHTSASAKAFSTKIGKKLRVNFTPKKNTVNDAKSFVESNLKKRSLEIDNEVSQKRMRYEDKLEVFEDAKEKQDWYDDYDEWLDAQDDQDVFFDASDELWGLEDIEEVRARISEAGEIPETTVKQVRAKISEFLKEFEWSAEKRQKFYSTFEPILKETKGTIQQKLNAVLKTAVQVIKEKSQKFYKWLSTDAAEMSQDEIDYYAYLYLDNEKPFSLRSRAGLKLIQNQFAKAYNFVYTQYMRAKYFGVPAVKALLNTGKVYEGLRNVPFIGHMGPSLFSLLPDTIPIMVGPVPIPIPTKLVSLVQFRSAKGVVQGLRGQTITEQVVRNVVPETILKKTAQGGAKYLGKRATDLLIKVGKGAIGAVEEIISGVVRDTTAIYKNIVEVYDAYHMQDQEWYPNSARRQQEFNALYKDLLEFEIEWQLSKDPKLVYIREKATPLSKIMTDAEYKAFEKQYKSDLYMLQKESAGEWSWTGRNWKDFAKSCMYSALYTTFGADRVERLISYINDKE